MSPRYFIELNSITGNRIVIDIADIKAFNETDGGTKIHFYSSEKQMTIVEETIEEVKEKIIRLNY